MAMETGLLSIVADSTPVMSPGSLNGALASPPAFDGSVSPVGLSATGAAFRPFGKNDAAVDADGCGLHSTSRK